MTKKLNVLSGGKYKHNIQHKKKERERRKRAGAR